MIATLDKTIALQAKIDSAIAVWPRSGVVSNGAMHTGNDLNIFSPPVPLKKGLRVRAEARGVTALDPPQPLFQRGQ